MLTGLELSISTVSNQKSIETTTTNALCFAKTVEASLAPLGWLLLSPRTSVTGQMHIISASTVATRVCFWADAVSFPLLLSPRASVTGQMQHHFRYWADAASFPLLPSPRASVIGQIQHHFRFCGRRARLLLGRCSIISVIGQMQYHFRFCRHHTRLFLGRCSIIPLPLGHLTQCPTVFLWILPFFSLKDSKKEKKKLH